MWDESKLSSYINNMLVPMATALKAHKGRFSKMFPCPVELEKTLTKIMPENKLEIFKSAFCMGNHKRS